jgi:hypothetical protein
VAGAVALAAERVEAVELLAAAVDPRDVAEDVERRGDVGSRRADVAEDAAGREDSAADVDAVKRRTEDEWGVGLRRGRGFPCWTVRRGGTVVSSVSVLFIVSAFTDAFCPPGLL